jgi:K+ transporter
MKGEAVCIGLPTSSPSANPAGGIGGVLATAGTSPRALFPLTLTAVDVTYFLGRETLIVSRAPGMAMWRERLFALMARNAVRATAFFTLPPERVVELGVQVEI